ncbi:MAG TPA: DUF3419 family protein [Planctomycetota bacterium]|nr:DUF3419 family protein [Planctomycetota bacterium]
MLGPPAPKLVEKSVHQHKLLSKKGLLERIFSFWFDSLVYNQIWEDPRVDMEALQLDSESRMLTIASGGCNILAYLAQKPRSITAVDINPNHIFLTRLKLAALQALPTHYDFFQFFGFANDEKNIEKYHQHISPRLDDQTRAFWEGKNWFQKLRPRIRYFKKNFYDYAKLGLLLRFAHGLTKVVRKNPSRILGAGSIEEQEQIFNETIAPFFDNKIIKAIGRNPLILFSLGIPPRQYAVMKREMSGDIIDLFRERIKRLTCGFPIEDNYFAWQALGRSYDTRARRAIPDYLKESNYDVLKSHAHRASAIVGNLTGFLRDQPAKSLNRFVFLDSQDWMQPWQIHELWAEVERTGMPGSRIIFRTGAKASPVEEALPKALRQRFKYEMQYSKELHKQDRSAIYGGFHLYVLR